MKHTGGLQRRTALVGSPETHRAWQQRSRKKQAGKPCTQPSRAGESRARRLVRARSGGLCEIRLNNRCTWWATEWSHRIRRSQGGSWTPSNGLAACHSCHYAVTNTNGRRDEYVALGLVLDSNQNPLEESAQTIHGRVLLDDNGGWTATTPQPKGDTAA